MLNRASKLQECIASFCARYGYEEFLLDDEEWLQADYLLCVMEPFVEILLSLTLDEQASIHHLEESMKHLRKKQVPWKRQILESLEVCRETLAGYHEQTTRNSIYAFFSSDGWEKEKRDTYRSSFEKALLRCQEKPETPIKEALLLSEANDELCRRLDSGTLEFWKAEHRTYPCVAKLARNILPVQASSGVIERLFNTARQASSKLNLPKHFLVVKPELISKPKPRSITEEFGAQFLSTFTTSFSFSGDQSTQYEILVAFREEKEIMAEEDFVMSFRFPN
ncbi:hypothetical protein N7488_008087 [Penicillium malachiteum]|nr:hypothetical protein N7488_008087 [Penicillium malachiteum]